MQDDQTRSDTADSVSSLNWVDYLSEHAPNPAPQRRRSFIPQSRAYTALMVVLLLLLAVYGVVSGNAAGVIIAVVLVAFVILPVGIVLALERRHPSGPHFGGVGATSEGPDVAASDTDRSHS